MLNMASLGENTKVATEGTLDPTEDEEDDEAEEDGEEEEEEEEDTVEPKLKYERLGNDVKEVLKNDAASCLAVQGKFLALGTHWGVVHILDLQGNRIKQFPCHSTTVNEISIDGGGDYVASCSDDGQVVVNGLYATDSNVKVNYDYPVRSLALDPEYGHRQSGQYVTGGENLVFHSKGMFRNKTTVLHGGEGPVRAIRWHKQFIAWANDVGVKIYDCQSKQRITYINRDEGSPRAELYRCNLCWRGDRTLLIGWGNSVKVCTVKERPKKDVRDLPSLYVEITHMTSVDFFIAGIAPVENNQIVLLCYLTNVEMEKAEFKRPQLRILTCLSDSHKIEESSLDELNMRGWEQYRCNDYRLEHLTQEGLFYLVSPRDVVLAKPRDMDDHVQWLIDNEKFEEALSEAETNCLKLKNHKVLDVGVQYIQFLIDEEDFQKAAGLCPRVLQGDKKLWEEIIMKFIEVKRLADISPFIPRTTLRLEPIIYELVLNTFLLDDKDQFCCTLQEWPSDLYDVQVILKAVEGCMEKDGEDGLLLEAMGQLHTFEGRFDKALRIYLKLKNEHVFELIKQHNLFSAIQDQIVELMHFQPTTASKMLIENMEKVPVAVVVDKLRTESKLLHQYLHTLFLQNVHAGQDFHELQLDLYAQYDQPNFLPFLKQSSSYPLQKAMQVCEDRELIEEQVYLLGRMGNHKQALSLIIEKMHDVDKAIEFSKEQNDEELWEDLIKYSIDKPDFITGLLRNIGTHIDPTRVIKRIPKGMEIPQLRDSLVKIMHDFNLQISLREGCDKILEKDCVGLLDRLNRLQRRGISVSDSQRCLICNDRIMPGDIRSARPLCAFFCHHVYHMDCLEAVSSARDDGVFVCQCCHSRKSQRGPKLKR
ncbi:vacuolar protein sorting-associated protein 41 homolog [Sycon ciliatum]|uniref:vacuolar protein sorting-associated protein 41 homolog n=1 Tax=Sycon ciliatum TaxID=27933 RepID=UPI0020A9A28E|eukprot:scpid30591/ scgid18008/ Vacuolar protein sorting-associated protein 41 homolog; S53